MTERKPHPDNALIDELTEGGGAADQQSRAGGNVAREVGTRAELGSALEGDIVERVTGDDKGPDNEIKGAKTMAKIRGGNQSR
jgi:hypothetical protein